MKTTMTSRDGGTRTLLPRFPGRRAPFRVRFDRNPHGKGWSLMIQFGKGAGYRYIDLPGKSTNVAHGWRCRLSISGRTFRIIRNAKVYRKLPNGARGPARHRFMWATPGFTRNANGRGFPGWWV